jgi:hypothetical protein
MAKVSRIEQAYEIRHRRTEKAPETPRPYNLPRVYDPAMLAIPVALGAVFFAAGFAAGVMWASWWR